MTGDRARYRLPAIAIVIYCALSACASPSSRIATSLTRYGLDAAQSRYVGDRLENNLSLGQLQQLGKAARTFGASGPGPLRRSDLVRASSEIEDDKVPIEVAQAAAGCGLLSVELGL